MKNLDAQDGVLVVGGGPAGCMAAITAARRGRRVLLAERNPVIGKKLAITGKGRCNLTNRCSVEELAENIPAGGKFLLSAFRRFSPADVMDFFEDLGVKLKVERGNRVFPVSDQAREVVEALERELSRLGVRRVTGRVSSLILESGQVKGAVLSQEGTSTDLPASSVLLATGGKSYPVTGSTGDGYRLAEQAGHTVVPPVPSLVPLVIRERAASEMMGLSLKNVTLTLRDLSSKKKLYEELGEMLFTHFGVSGPLVLSASSHIRKMEPGRYGLEIDLKPGLSPEKLDARLVRDFAEEPNRDFSNVLRRLLPSKMIGPMVKLTGIPGETKANSITRSQRQRLGELVKRLPLTVEGFRPVEEAIVTSGGVSLKEVSPKTMESKRISGLFFAGELLDADGYTGGFNLQIAFSTGRAAGEFL